MSGGADVPKRARRRRPTARGCLAATLLASLSVYCLNRLAISFGVAWSVSL